MPIEPFTILLSLLPLIAYLFVLGLIRVSGRAIVTTGGRDIAALGIAISGLLAAGPAQLFFPSSAPVLLVPIVWCALITFYALCVTLVALTSTPKLVTYGRSPEELYGALLKAALRIDPATTGDPKSLQVMMPSVEIHLRVDGQRAVDYSQVVSFEPGVSLQFWSKLLGNLRNEVAATSAPTPRRGFAMLVAATLLAVLAAWQGVEHQELVVDGFRDWLWR